MDQGIYIHVPFCAQKCPYCDFYSLAAEDALMTRYTDAICAELGAYSTANRFLTLYFGGGTPYLLGTARIAKILHEAKPMLAPQAEITLEANPCDVHVDDLRTLRKLGMNRLSLGVQSLHDSELKLIGRRHSAAQALDAIQAAQHAGFDNLSADLMLGLPGQTQADLEYSIRTLCKSGVVHLSAYILKIEEGTPFAENNMQSRCPDEDTVSQMYLFAVDLLAKLGFAQYEISNFCKSGYESRHNLIYWHGGAYLGIGAGAHGYYHGYRYCHGRNLQDYLADCNTVTITDQAPDPLQEYVMLGLRLTEGIDTVHLQAQFGKELTDFFKQVSLLCQNSLAQTDGVRVWLTPKGFLVSNRIISMLLDTLSS